MNILLLTTRLNLGGIAIYTISLAKSLKDRGENVIVASSGGELVDELKEKGIEHVKLSIDTSADIGFHTLGAYFKLSKLIKEKEIDLIHAQTRVTQVIAGLLSKRTGVAFITTCHGFFKQKWFRNIFPCWGDSTIAISDAVREHLVNDMGVSKEKIKLIYNGIDIEKFDRKVSEEDKAVIRKEYGLRGTAVIGIISRLSDVKGHKYLFNAFMRILKHYPGLQLLVIGDGPRNYTNSLKELVKNLNISDKVIFHKACRDTSIPLSIIDIFCLPSLQEGLGLSILEAMAMGVPVVASDVGGIYTLIKHRENGLLVEPKNEVALSGAISELLSDTSFAKKMAERSKELVRKKFTLDMMADNTLNTYKEILG